MAKPRPVLIHALTGVQAKAASNVPGHTKIFAQSLLAEAECDDKIAALLSFGTRLAEVRKAAEALQSRGLTPTVADTRFAKPPNRDLTCTSPAATWR